MCLRICLYEEFGGGHFFAAEGIPEAKFCAEKKIESVDFFKGKSFMMCKLMLWRYTYKQIFLHKFTAVFQWKWKDSNITGTVFQGSENFLILADDRGNHHSRIFGI